MAMRPLWLGPTCSLDQNLLSQKKCSTSVPFCKNRRNRSMRYSDQSITADAIGGSQREVYMVA